MPLNWSSERMGRTLDGEARAFLSSRYRRLDNELLVSHVLPALSEHEIDLKQSTFSINPTNLYMKIVFPRVQGEVRVDDIVQSGVLITNSEVGVGMLRVTPLIFRLVCTNGMVAPESVHQFKRTHLGKQLEFEGAAARLYRDETRIAADRAVWMEVETSPGPQPTRKPSYGS